MLNNFSNFYTESPSTTEPVEESTTVMVTIIQDEDTTTTQVPKGMM